MAVVTGERIVKDNNLLVERSIVVELSKEKSKGECRFVAR